MGIPMGFLLYPPRYDPLDFKFFLGRRERATRVHTEITIYLLSRRHVLTYDGGRFSVLGVGHIP